jgi:hypothetical protein
MGMPSASIQSGTQPQGKGFAQPGSQLSGLGSQIGQQQNMMNDPSVYTAAEYPQVQQAQAGQPRGKGGRVTTPSTGGQPQMGQPSVGAGMPQPNMYTNTVGQWDNASIQPQQSRNRGGKGKG